MNRMGIKAECSANFPAKQALRSGHRAVILLFIEEYTQ